MTGQLLGLHNRLMLADPIHLHNKIYLVATTGTAVAAKTGPGPRLWIYLHARGLVIMEGTS